MGRNAGWIALHSGISGTRGRDPDPRDPVRHREGLRRHPRRGTRPGKHFSIVVVAEGARPVGGEVSLLERRGAGTVDRHRRGREPGGADDHASGWARRSARIVLGHLQRGGSPTTFDRLLGLRFGGAAVRAVADGAFGTMLGLAGHGDRPGAAGRSGGTAEAGAAGLGHRRDGARAGHQPWRLGATMSSRSCTASRSSTRTAGWRTESPTRSARGRRHRTRETEAWLAAVPARAAIRRRLQQLLGIGVLGTPTPARGRYLYQRRDGSTNQPVLYLRDGLDGRRPGRHRSQCAFRRRHHRPRLVSPESPTGGCSPTACRPMAANRACCTCSTSTR